MSKPAARIRALLLSGALSATVLTVYAADSVYPNETPEHFTPRLQTFDYTKREVMIAMRDGVKLKTVILIPRGAKRAPILLTRTPYDATDRIAKKASAHLAALIDSNDVADDLILNGGYIRVMQDVRGKHKSEGDYAMTRPLVGPLNPTAGRSLHRYLRHHRLAGQKYPRDQWQSRHSRHLLRRVHLADGPGAPTSGATRRGTYQRDGRRLARR